MGQAEVYDFLIEREKNWISTVEIVNGINSTNSLVRRALNQLYKYGEVLKKEINNKSKLGGDKWRIKK